TNDSAHTNMTAAKREEYETHRRDDRKAAAPTLALSTPRPRISPSCHPAAAPTARRSYSALRAASYDRHQVRAVRRLCDSPGARRDSSVRFLAYPPATAPISPFGFRRIHLARGC